MEEYNLYIISLYDIYNSLLTSKQKLYFEDYYFNNLSLSEMSENYEVSRNAIHKQIKEVNSKLEDFELKIKIKENNIKLKELINKIDDSKLRLELEKIIEE